MALVVLGLVWRLRAAPAPRLWHSRPGGAVLDGLVLLFLLLAIIARRAHADPLWTEGDGQISYHLSECLAQGRIFDPADSASGARCAKLITAPALLAVLCISVAVCVCSVLSDLRHHSALVSILQLPISQVDETDPQALSMSASQAALRLPLSKRRLLSAHLRALRTTSASPEAEAAALALAEALPSLCDVALEAPPKELAAMQAMLSRLVTAGNDGPVATALRLPSRLRLLGHLLDGESAASLQSLSARESLLRLLREISSHHALPETLPGEADLFEGSTTLRVPADSIMVDASHELGLYAQVSTVDASGCFASAEEAASAAAAAAEGELVSLWLPVTTMGDFDLADRTVTVSYDPESVAAAVDADRAATRRTATPESAAPDWSLSYRRTRWSRPATRSTRSASSHRTSSRPAPTRTFRSA